MQLLLHLNFGALALAAVHSQLATRDNSTGHPGGSGPAAVVLPPSDLPDPSKLQPEQVLVGIFLGAGFQNYTCAQSTDIVTTIPSSVGAVARLFNATNSIYTHTSVEATLTSDAVTMTHAAATAETLLGLPRAGQHFYDKHGVPIFHFDTEGLKTVFAGKKLASVPALDGANPGPNKTGAVDWLEIGSNGHDNQTTGFAINYVYRVLTAGGKAPQNCSGQGSELSIPYAALYWAYGRHAGSH